MRDLWIARDNIQDEPDDEQATWLFGRKPDMDEKGEYFTPGAQITCLSEVQIEEHIDIKPGECYKVSFTKEEDEDEVTSNTD